MNLAKTVHINSRHSAASTFRWRWNARHIQGAKAFGKTRREVLSEVCQEFSW
jgi:hypothetical protein